MKSVLFILPFVLCSAGLASGQLYQLSAVTLETPEDAICPPDSDWEAARMNITNSVSHILQEIAAEINTVPECGGSGWRRVAFLNMTDTTQQCPDSWREYDQGGVRVCGRHESDIASCSSAEYSSDGVEYTHVCGRIIGYQFGSPDGYSESHRDITLPPGDEINEPYVDGVSVTYDNSRQHIWTLYGGLHKFHYGCCNPPISISQPPPFIEQNYFCDTGNPHNVAWQGTFYSMFPLWDSDANCPSNANCCASHSGPWFNTTLTTPTTGDIEIRVCGDESSSNEDAPLELIEIYVM